MRTPAAALALLALSAFAAPAQDGRQQVGLRFVSVPDPVGGQPIHAALFYPASLRMAPQRFGAIEFAAARDAPPAPGLWRLIVLSHGTAASMLSHVGLATYLAANGIAVAAPQHPGDNFADASAVGTDMSLHGRPRHLARTIDFVLADRHLGPVVDAGRIGAIGYSAGGYTALVAAGGVPDFARMSDYCREQPDDMLMCAGGLKGRIAIRRPDWGPLRDPRVKAVVLLAPGPAFLFARDGLARVTAPIRLYYAERDSVVREPWNAQHLAAALPRLPETVAIPHAGHFAFLWPCPFGPQEWICADRPGFDRAAMHARMNREILDFLDRTLGREPP